MSELETRVIEALRPIACTCVPPILPDVDPGKECARCYAIRMMGTPKEQCDRIFAAITESILTASDEEILADAAANGEDVERIAAETKAAVLATIARGATCEERSGVCHCGASMDGHSLYDNHSAVEMARPTESKGIHHEAAGNLAFLLSVVRCGETLSDDEVANVRRVIADLGAADLDMARAAVADTARRCAWICEAGEVLLPISAWGGTKKEHGAAVAVELGAMIRREFGLEGVEPDYPSMADALIAGERGADGVLQWEAGDDD